MNFKNINTFICLSLLFLSAHAQKVTIGNYSFKKNGGTYYGELVGGKPDGKGKTNFVNGDVYEGDYVKGKRQGTGAYLFSDGEKYEGDWYDDKQHGKGTFYFSNNNKHFIKRTIHAIYLQIWKLCNVFPFALMILKEIFLLPFKKVL